MRQKRTKVKVPVPPTLAEMSGNDRDLLTKAYKSGLIVGWRQDSERGYRLTLGDRRDEYVDITRLSHYLDKLRQSA